MRWRPIWPRCGAEVSRETISKITDRVLEGMVDWQNRPLDRVYPVVFIDAIVVKIRDGQVANRPIYVVVGVTVDGERDILGLWAGSGGEGAKFWHQVLTDVRNRGVADVCILVCDGLTGLPDAVTAVWPRTVVQTCVIHLLRNSFRYASKKDWPALARDLKPVYTAATEAAALARLADFAETWEARYPAIVKLWENAWAEFVPFLASIQRFARSSTRPTRSKVSTLGSAGRSRPAGTFRPSRPPSSTST